MTLLYPNYNAVNLTLLYLKYVRNKELRQQDGAARVLVIKQVNEKYLGSTACLVVVSLL